MIGILLNIHNNLRIKWNFELTVFELTVPDLYSKSSWYKLQMRNDISGFVDSDKI